MSNVSAFGLLRGIVLACLGVLGACASRPLPLPAGDAAYHVIPPSSAAAVADYLIRPLDVISVTVFKEPDLSFEKLPVDAAGDIQFPLIDSLRAAGLTPRQLAEELTRRLDREYLRDAQVSVAIASSESRRVIVEGNVVQPGAYEITQGTTLLQAVALAKSPTRTARLDQVVVFRVAGAQRLGAVFDLRDIRAGRSPDPELQAGDTVVVGFDAVKGGFRDFLAIAPLAGFFAVF